jgi:hypothetical protein
MYVDTQSNRAGRTPRCNKQTRITAFRPVNFRIDRIYSIQLWSSACSSYVICIRNRHFIGKCVYGHARWECNENTSPSQGIPQVCLQKTFSTDSFCRQLLAPRTYNVWSSHHSPKLQNFNVGKSPLISNKQPANVFTIIFHPHNFLSL